jgi:hypothetical protein
MATTYAVSGVLNLTLNIKVTASGDQTGTTNLDISELLRFAPSGADAVITGGWKGTAVCAAGDWLMAHASDPLGSMGTAAYSPGFTPASSKLKLLVVINEDGTNSITIARKTTNGLNIFPTADHSITVAANGIFVWYSPAGSAALTTGSTDGLTIAVSGGTPSATVLAGYGS